MWLWLAVNTLKVLGGRVHESGESHVVDQVALAAGELLDENIHLLWGEVRGNVALHRLLELDWCNMVHFLLHVLAGIVKERLHGDPLGSAVVCDPLEEVVKLRLLLFADVLPGHSGETLVVHQPFGLTRHSLLWCPLEVLLSEDAVNILHKVPVAYALLLVLGVGVLLGKTLQFLCVKFEARHVQTGLELALRDEPTAELVEVGEKLLDTDAALVHLILHLPERGQPTARTYFARHVA
mmetsp:Transcript_11642/g.24355  ORF Transcript_11642/g.24355 Transcript_11642/m.24355 type:complete len:238 (+) Transcript_11642:184-897(+)